MANSLVETMEPRSLREEQDTAFLKYMDAREQQILMDQELDAHADAVSRHHAENSQWEGLDESAAVSRPEVGAGGTETRAFRTSPKLMEGLSLGRFQLKPPDVWGLEGETGAIPDLWAPPDLGRLTAASSAANNPIPAQSEADASYLAGRLLKGAWNGAVGMVTEPILQVRDMAAAGASVFYNELIRGEKEEYWFPTLHSGVAKAAEGGASQTRLLLQANPVTAPGVMTYDATTAIMEGRYGDAAEMVGGAASGLVAGKLVSKYGNYNVRSPVVFETSPNQLNAGIPIRGFQSPLVQPASLGEPLITVDPALVGESRLLGANRAVINPRKVVDYALNPDHPVGGNKAIVFERLGFTSANAEELMSQIRTGVMENTPFPGKVNQFGPRFTVDIPVVGPRASGVVRTGWIYDPGSSTPRLTTLFVK